MGAVGVAGQEAAKLFITRSDEVDVKNMSQSWNGSWWVFLDTKHLSGIYYFELWLRSLADSHSLRDSEGIDGGEGVEDRRWWHMIVICAQMVEVEC